MAIETVTNRAKLRILNGTTDLDTSPIRVCYLVGTGVSGLTAATVQDLNFLSELDAIANVTLSTERLTLASLTVTEDDTNNWAVADATDPVFGAVAENAEGVAFYHFITDDTASPLISVHNTGFPQPVNGGLTIQMPNGWLRGV
jgi:hypothetical protein